MTTAAEAVALVGDGCTVACAGFVGAAHPEELTAALEDRFVATGHPRGLTLIYAAGQGDGQQRGMNHLAHQGLLARVIGGHWGLAPSLGKLALDGCIEAYNFPQGVISQLFRDIAAGRPGCLTHVGLGTLADPDLDGGRLNDRTPRALVEKVRVRGKDWLLYHSLPIDVALLRATAVDPHGNLSLRREAIKGELLPMAQAARNSGGLVIAQVASVSDEAFPPHEVAVPGILVDRVVLSAPDKHHQTFAEEFNASYVRPAPTGAEAFSPEPLAAGLRRIIACRACDEMNLGDIVNLGIGMPEGVARVAAERGLLDRVTLTVESGPIGGLPAGGLSFGASAFPEAIIDQPAQFDFYDGGGIDLAVLGAAEIDRAGNVNVSRFGSRIAGVGGFINIAQNARKVVFCGAFTAGSLEIAMDGGLLHIKQEGSVRKFHDGLPQISFSAAHARHRGQTILYVTERAVFRLGDDRLELSEIAPGIDPAKDIFPYMGFRPSIRDLQEMPRHCFLPPAPR